MFAQYELEGMLEGGRVTSIMQVVYMKLLYVHTRHCLLMHKMGSLMCNIFLFNET